MEKGGVNRSLYWPEGKKTGGLKTRKNSFMLAEKRGCKGKCVIGEN